ncbi:unnamed protein product [Dicrocoelium dendriticum]|nr:unnamed protein product [Dicrocoelium dendriticum]
MNIFPEVMLAAFYRAFSRMQPIDFYDWAATNLQSLTASSMCITAFLLTGNGLASILYAVLFMANRLEMSRVTYTLPLRENFALPFWWLRALFVTVLLQTNEPINFKARSHFAITMAVFLSTTLFCVTWQFSQFALLLDALTFTLLHHIGLLTDDKVQLFIEAFI